VLVQPRHEVLEAKPVSLIKANQKGAIEELPELPAELKSGGKQPLSLFGATAIFSAVRAPMSPTCR
jgi:hypothetical protein